VEKVLGSIPSYSIFAFRCSILSCIFVYEISWLDESGTGFVLCSFGGSKYKSMRGLHSQYSEWFEQDMYREETYLVDDSGSDVDRMDSD
jgi:hypothetical protein